jgi:hypothetical protein
MRFKFAIQRDPSRTLARPHAALHASIARDVEREYGDECLCPSKAHDRAAGVYLRAVRRSRLLCGIGLRGASVSKGIFVKAQ